MPYDFVSRGELLLFRLGVCFIIRPRLFSWSSWSIFGYLNYLTIYFEGGSASSCNSPIPASPRTAALGRCLSPLLIHSSRGGTPDTTCAAPPASPLGAIQPDLYLRKDGPLFIGGHNKSGKSLGRLHFRLSYDFDRSDLVVHLIEGKMLLQMKYLFILNSPFVYHPH